MNKEKERQQLLDLRSRVAKKNGQSTYLVFNDEELETLLKVRPKSLEELAKIKGFPMNGKRVEAYGRDVVAIFKGRGDILGALSSLEDSKIF